MARKTATVELQSLFHSGAHTFVLPRVAAHHSPAVILAIVSHELHKATVADHDIRQSRMRALDSAWLLVNPALIPVSRMATR